MDQNISDKMSKNSNAIGSTNFKFPNQEKVYHGKVRDVYFVGDKLVMVATDRISAFDHILPRPIPYKGQVLNQVASHFLNATRDIVPNWLEHTPDPNVAVGKKCEPIMLEMVVRGYMAGHAWREYKAGKRELCGEIMLDGLRQNDRFPRPLITPATKAEEGHDEDISKAEILAQGIVTPAQWEQLEDYTLQLFWRGTEMAAERGLILVDTKYEFGLIDGEIVLMDEIHTPDSSRYFFADGYHLIIIKDSAEYNNFLITEDIVSKGVEIDFAKYYLVGFQGYDKCDPSNYDSNFSIYQDSIVIDLFINQGNCLNLVHINKWFLVNRKYINSEVKFKVHEITAQLKEIRIDCFFHTGFKEETLIISTEEEYKRIFSRSNNSCKPIDFGKYSLVAEYNALGGCGYPKLMKTVEYENDSLVIHSRVIQLGWCKRMNHLYSTHLIEKKLLDDYEYIIFRKDFTVVYER